MVLFLCLSCEYISNQNYFIMEYYSVYDEVTNKTVYIMADCLKMAENIASLLDWESINDGSYI